MGFSADARTIAGSALPRRELTSDEQEKLAWARKDGTGRFRSDLPLATGIFGSFYRGVGTVAGGLTSFVAFTPLFQEMMFRGKGLAKPMAAAAAVTGVVVGGCAAFMRNRNRQVVEAMERLPPNATLSDLQTTARDVRALRESGERSSVSSFES